MEYNTPKDLLSPEELFIYNILGYPLNVFILHKALTTKLKDDPDYEVWVPFTYCKLSSHRVKGKLFLNPPNIIINNKGVIHSLREDPVRELQHRVVKGYIVTSFAFDGNEGHVMIHRSIACSFIPPNPNNAPGPLCRLQVNHLDGDKLNYSLGNLEWATPSQNATHAHATGLAKTLFGKERTDTKSVKGRVTVGTYKDLEFILHGKTDTESLGFCSRSTRRAAEGTTNHYRNCFWSFATEEEIKTLPNTISKEVLKELDEYNSRIKSWILATNTKTGNQVVIKGGAVELKSLGFTPQLVSSVILGKYKAHKDHLFERISR